MKRVRTRLCLEPHSGIRIYCKLFPNRSDRNSIFYSKKSPSPGFSASGRNFYLLFCKKARHKEEVTSLFWGIPSNLLRSVEFDSEYIEKRLFRNITNRTPSHSKAERSTKLHGCHRNPFSKLPDFCLIRITFFTLLSNTWVNLAGRVYS